MGEWVTNVAPQELTKTERWDMRLLHMLTLQLIHHGRYSPGEPPLFPHFIVPTSASHCLLRSKGVSCLCCTHHPGSILPTRFFVPSHFASFSCSFPSPCSLLYPCLCLWSCYGGSFFISASIYWGCLFFFHNQNSKQLIQWVPVDTCGPNEKMHLYCSKKHVTTDTSGGQHR